MLRLVLSGVVVSKSYKTVKVMVMRSVMHAKYKKVVKRTRNYIVHDDGNQCVVGMSVLIETGRPISRKKKWNAILENK